MCHELEIVDEIRLLLGGIELEVLQLLGKDAIVHLEFFLVVLRLSLDPVLELSKGHLLFILVH